MIISPSNAQNFSSHQWKDRVVIIRSETSSNDLYNKQINELKEHEKGILDRKIVIYRTVNEKYQIGLEEDEKWENSEEGLIGKINSQNSFEILLIGLDGSVKLRKNELLTYEELFGIIDQMPMRRAEMRKKKDNN